MTYSTKINPYQNKDESTNHTNCMRGGFGGKSTGVYVKKPGCSRQCIHLIRIEYSSCKLYYGAFLQRIALRDGTDKASLFLTALLVTTHTFQIDADQTGRNRELTKNKTTEK